MRCRGQGVAFWLVRMFTQPRWQTPFRSGVYQAPCGMETTPGRTRFRHTRGDHERAAVIENFHPVAICDAPELASSALIHIT